MLRVYFAMPYLPINLYNYSLSARAAESLTVSLAHAQQNRSVRPFRRSRIAHNYSLAYAQQNRSGLRPFRVIGCRSGMFRS